MKKVIKLRTAKNDDLDFLYNLHKSTLREYIDQIWGWDEKWQRKYFSQRFELEELQIITLEGIDIGSISVIHKDQEIFLNRIEILPEYQNRGIGTCLIKKIMINAQSKGKSITLQVFKINKRARKLYEGLGFSICGETRTHYQMKYPPNNQ